MSWIDRLLTGGYAKIQIAGVDQPQEIVLNFASGATAVDDPAADRTTVTITPVGITAGTYSSQLLSWDGFSWSPNTTGAIKFKAASPIPSDATGQVALTSGVGFVGVVASPLSGDPYALVRAPLNGDAVLMGDSTAGNNETKIGVKFGGVDHYGIRIGTVTDEGGNPIAVSLSYFDGAPVSLQSISGVTLLAKQNSLFAALGSAGYNLINDTTTSVRNDFVVAATDVTATIGTDNLGSVDVGTFVSVATTTAMRGFRAYQINNGAQGARVTLHKARGTTSIPAVPNNADGIARVETRSWDGSAWVACGYLDWEVRDQFGPNISGSLPPVRAKLTSFGPSYAGNELGTGNVAFPLSDTYHDVSHTLSNNTPTVVVTTQTINNDTVTLFRVVIVGKDQSTSDWYFRDVRVLVKKIGAGAAAIQTMTGGVDQFFKTDATWDSTFAIVSNQLQVSITSDATNSVHWSTYVQETTIPNA